MKSWYSVSAKAGGTAEIKIYDEIGMWGVSARQFSDDLTALGQVKNINLHIHSPGGDVFDGIAIYNLLNKHPATLTVYIDGLAASMASVIAMAGDRIVMPANALMMIHKPWGISGGNANDMRDYAELLDKVENVLIPAYAGKTGKSAEELGLMLESETWMDGNECLAQGFADEILPSVSAMARIESNKMKDFENMPQSLKNMIIDPKGSAPQSVSAEQQRINDIKNVFSGFNGRHHQLQASCIEDASCNVEQAREKLLDELGKQAFPVARQSLQAHIYSHNGNITGDSIRQGLFARLGHEKAERDNPYAMMSLFDMARSSLSDRGIGIAGMGRGQIVGMAFTHSSSDFSSILSGGAEKSLLTGWELSGETFMQWTKKGTLSNFHEAKRVGLGSFGALDKVPEGAEYKYITTSDRGEPIALATYGNIFSITRQAIINDDLNQLTTIPVKMGRMAARTIGDLVYNILISNPKLSDGKTLFNAGRGNLLSKTPGFNGMVDARTAMRLQADSEGNPLNITPAYILAPAALEAAVLQVINSTATLNAPNPGVFNPVNRMGEPVIEPRLDKADPKAWYVASAQGTDTIEVAYLDGQDTPYLEQQEGFTVDGVAYKVRIDAGVAPLDFRGLVKSTGIEEGA